MALLTIAQAAEFLRVPEATIAGWVDDGQIVHVRRADGTVVMPLGAIQAAITEQGLLT